jgi:hypothetical protein
MQGLLFFHSPCILLSPFLVLEKMVDATSSLAARFDASLAAITESNADVCRRSLAVASDARAAGAKCSTLVKDWRMVVSELEALPQVMRSLSQCVADACARCDALEFQLHEVAVARAEVREARWRHQRLLEAEAAQTELLEAEQRAEAAARQRAAEKTAERERQVAAATAERQRTFHAQFEAQRDEFLSRAAISPSPRAAASTPQALLPRSPHMSPDASGGAPTGSMAVGTPQVRPLTLADVQPANASSADGLEDFYDDSS